MFEPRYNVHYERSVRIPMPDGITLAADFFWPDAPGQFPVAFEYTPYRKSDSDWRAFHIHRYLAARGIAAARLDVRGSGDSEGTALDEYCPQEQLDGVAFIAWMARQPWCNGNVGMFGTSYGGFTSLQVAMQRPPALKAIVPAMFTDRRYTDDCHYKGGALQMLYDVGTYGLSMAGRNVLPPRPEFVGERWLNIWEQHLQNEPWLLRWLEHQTEDEQWRHGSLCEDYAAIQCATYLVGGWRDGYVNCNLRTFQHLTCPKKLIIGPWLHSTPDTGVPGPRIDYPRELVRFFGHWLAGTPTGIMDEPPITIYVQQYDPPRPNRATTSGFWRHEAAWPLDRRADQTLYLSPGALRRDEAPAEATVDTITYNPTVGTAFGIFSAGGPHFVPGDQRLEEALSSVYTTPVLDQPVEILGYPRAILHVDASVEVLTFVVRLCDVAPDGSSALVTKGVLNATHRESHSDPSPLTPGQLYELEIELDATSWLFEPGHRIRLSVSNADFPNTWPSPTPATSRVHHGAARPSRLVLPAIGEATSQPLPPPNLGPVQTDVDPNRGTYRVTRDHANGQVEVTIGSDAVTRRRIDELLTIESMNRATAIVAEHDPARASITGQQMARYIWPDRTVEMRLRGEFQSDATTIHALVHVALTMDGLPHFSRRWSRTFPRRLL
jgi:putative CocE/NonD family hydrolase